MRAERAYYGEFNRCRGDNIRLCARRLNASGIPTEVVPHRTTLRMVRPPGMDWPLFLKAIKRELNPRLGSVLLHSKRTGRTFLCRNNSNRRGLFRYLR